MTRIHNLTTGLTRSITALGHALDSTSDTNDPDVVESYRSVEEQVEQLTDLGEEIMELSVRFSAQILDVLISEEDPDDQALL